MDKVQRAKFAKQLRRANVLESLKDIGASSGKSIKEDLLKQGSEEFFKQMFGAPEPKKFSGDIQPGETVELTEIFAGKQEEIVKQKGQIALERRLVEEERILVDKKTGELRLQLHAISLEVYELAKSTQGLAEEVKVAAMQAPVEPGEYHVVFFEKLLEFIQSFRKKIEDAGLWLHAGNKRAERKNYWTMYKKKGSSFLLAPDHYLQRSAG